LTARHALPWDRRDECPGAVLEGVSLLKKSALS
jgi:hypothetical protein